MNRCFLCVSASASLQCLVFIRTLSSWKSLNRVVFPTRHIFREGRVMNNIIISAVNEHNINYLQ